MSILYTGEKKIIAPRDAKAFLVPSNFFGAVSVDGPQIGDFNLCSEDDLSEMFYSGKNRALHECCMR